MDLDGFLQALGAAIRYQGEVANTVVATKAAGADATAQARVRETYAQLVPAETKKPGSPVQRKRKIAKSRPAQPLRFAQQQHFGFFGNSTW